MSLSDVSDIEHFLGSFQSNIYNSPNYYNFWSVLNRQSNCQIVEMKSFIFIFLVSCVLIHVVSSSHHHEDTPDEYEAAHKCHLQYKLKDDGEHFKYSPSIKIDIIFLSIFTFRGSLRIDGKKFTKNQMFCKMHLRENGIRKGIVVELCKM